MRLFDLYTQIALEKNPSLTPEEAAQEAKRMIREDEKADAEYCKAHDC